MVNDMLGMRDNKVSLGHIAGVSEEMKLAVLGHQDDFFRQHMCATNRPALQNRNILSMYTLFAGLGIVGIFSDPMCDVLSAMTNTDYTGSLGSHIPINPFFVSFIVTPICSNASELISSLAFAAKKTKKSISMT